MKKLLMTVLLTAAAGNFTPSLWAQSSAPQVPEALPREVERLQKRQQELNREMKARLEEVERKYPALVEKNKKLFERLQASQKTLDGSLEKLSEGDVNAAFQQQADFFSEMANVFVEGINFMRDDEEKKSPPIGTFLKKEGSQVQFPREKKMTLGKKPFYEAENLGPAPEVVTHSVDDAQTALADASSYMEAVEHDLKKSFQSRRDSQETLKTHGSKPEGAEFLAEGGKESPLQEASEKQEGHTEAGGAKAGAARAQNLSKELTSESADALESTQESPSDGGGSGNAAAKENGADAAPQGQGSSGGGSEAGKDKGADLSAGGAKNSAAGEAAAFESEEEKEEAMKKSLEVFLNAAAAEGEKNSGKLAEAGADAGSGEGQTEGEGRGFSGAGPDGGSSSQEIFETAEASGGLGGGFQSGEKVNLSEAPAMEGEGSIPGAGGNGLASGTGDAAVPKSGTEAKSAAQGALPAGQNGGYGGGGDGEGFSSGPAPVSRNAEKDTEGEGYSEDGGNAEVTASDFSGGQTEGGGSLSGVSDAQKKETGPSEGQTSPEGLGTAMEGQAKKDFSQAEGLTGQGFASGSGSGMGGGSSDSGSGAGGGARAGDGEAQGDGGDGSFLTQGQKGAGSAEDFAEEVSGSGGFVPPGTVSQGSLEGPSGGLQKTESVESALGSSEFSGSGPSSGSGAGSGDILVGGKGMADSGVSGGRSEKASSGEAAGDGFGKGAGVNEASLQNSGESGEAGTSFGGLDGRQNGSALTGTQKTGFDQEPASVKTNETVFLETREAGERGSGGGSGHDSGGEARSSGSGDSSGAGGAKASEPQGSGSRSGAAGDLDAGGSVNSDHSGNDLSAGPLVPQKPALSDAEAGSGASNLSEALSNGKAEGSGGSGEAPLAPADRQAGEGFAESLSAGEVLSQGQGISAGPDGFSGRGALEEKVSGGGSQRGFGGAGKSEGLGAGGSEDAGQDGLGQGPVSSNQTASAAAAVSGVSSQKDGSGSGGGAGEGSEEGAGGAAGAGGQNAGSSSFVRENSAAGAGQGSGSGGAGGQALGTALKTNPEGLPPSTETQEAPEEQGKDTGPVNPANQKNLLRSRQKNLAAAYAQDKLTGEVQPLQEGQAEDSEDLADPLRADVRESEKEHEILDEQENINPVREWLLQEKLLLHELKKFKPVRQPNEQNPPWEYYLMRQKQMMNDLKQIRRRIEFLGKKDEFFIELRHLSEIANRLLSLLNRGEFTDYKAAGKAYDALLSELELVKLPETESAGKEQLSRAGEKELLPEAYRGAVSQYFQRLSEE